MPEDQPRPGQLLNGKQVKLLAQHAMVALLRFFDLVQIGVEIFLAEKRSSVNALQLRVLLVSQPVSPGDIQQLECFDLARRRDVRSAAEVEKVASLVSLHREAKTPARRGCSAAQAPASCVRFFPDLPE